MKGCDKLVDAGRRQFLRGGAMATAGAAAATVVPSRTQAKPMLARVEYPSSRLANVKDLKPNQVKDIAYPDKDRPGRPDQARHARAGRRGTGRRHRWRSPRFARTRAFRSTIAPTTRPSIAPGTTRASTARTAASRSAVRQPRTCRNTHCAWTTRATSTPKAWMSCSTAACPTCSDGRKQP